MYTTIAQPPTSRYVDLVEAVNSAITGTQRFRAERMLEEYLDRNGLIGTLLDQRDAFDLYPDSFEFEFNDRRRITCRAHSGEMIAAVLAHAPGWKMSKVDSGTWFAIEDMPEQV